MAQMAMADELDLIDVLESSPIGSVILDQNGEVLFWNSSLLEILGGLQGEAFAAAASQGFFLEKRDFDTACIILARIGEVRNREVQLARADRSEAWAAVSMRMITFENQSAMLIWYFNVTESRLREQALERSQDTLLRVLDAAPIGAAISDGPGRVSYWNHALISQMSSLAETDPSAVIRAGVALAADKVKELGAGRPFELSHLKATNKWFAAWESQILFEGCPASLVWVHDVTDLRRAEIEAERATRSKSSFLATMSHEIRTPMNGVKTIAELLFGTPLSTEQREMVVTIKDSADALVAIVNDILDFSKIEAGKLEITSHPFKLSRVIDGVVHLLQPKAEEKGLSLAFRSAIALDGWYCGDEMRLRQILLNLVGNAVKFTASGSVALEIVPDGSQIRFNIVDTGIGIPADRIKDLFAPFEQADASTARTYGGTGLGLSICKALVRMLGGMIGVDSVPGKGSSFWFTLPLPPVDPPENDTSSREGAAIHQLRWRAPNRQTAELHGAVVLCAEDNKTNRDVLAHVLSRLGIVFDMVGNGVEALQHLDRNIHGLLLTDGHMPEMDGWTLTRQLREDERQHGLARLPIVALTADAVAGIEEKCLSAGMDGYLTKPLSIGSVDVMACRWLPALPQLRSPETLLGADDAGYGQATAGQVIDLTMLADLVGSDFSVIEPMLRNFLDSAASLITDITDGLEAGDQQQVMRTAHSLKSASQYVGAQRLSDTAAAIEQTASEGHLENLPALVRPLHALLGQIADAINDLRIDERLRQIREDIGELSAANAGLNNDVALESVLGITDSAADRILSAAEIILEKMGKLPDADDAVAVQSAVVAIFEACSFQDLTGQRVRTVLDRLSQIEKRLDSVVRASARNPAVAAIQHVSGQSEIDTIFDARPADRGGTPAGT